MTPLDMHLEQWKTCTRCEYHTTRHKIVLGKGDIPCDILFCGESPGQSENMIGVPFVGKAGKLLDRIIFKVFGPISQRKYRLAYNNVIACIPIVSGHEKEEPDASCVKQCKPRLEEFIKISQPKLIVAVGTTANEWLDKSYKHGIKFADTIPLVTIQHPAFILRLPAPAQPLAEHRATVVLSSAVTEHLEKGEQ